MSSSHQQVDAVLLGEAANLFRGRHPLEHMAFKPITGKVKPLNHAEQSLPSLGQDATLVAINATLLRREVRKQGHPKAPEVFNHMDDVQFRAKTHSELNSRAECSFRLWREIGRDSDIAEFHEDRLSHCGHLGRLGVESER